jgi:hypothetical protein
MLDATAALGKLIDAFDEDIIPRAETNATLIGEVVAQLLSNPPRHVLNEVADTDISNTNLAAALREVNSRARRLVALRDEVLAAAAGHE